MNSLGPVVFILFVAFMLFFLWSVKDVSGQERRMEWFVEACAPSAERPTCKLKSGPLKGHPTPYMCQKNAVLKAVELLKQYPGYVVMKFGCRRASLDV